MATHNSTPHTNEPTAPVRKRNRVILNCLNCKRRKVKCDRQSPCQRCIKSGLPCEYQQPEWNNNAGREVAQFQVQRLGIPGNYNQGTYQSELQELKDRIRQLETNNPPLKIQKAASYATSREQIDKFKYDPDNNPTFIGINPYADYNETINFYKDYNSIHVSSVTRRYNAGPFSWLALMKKDPALLQSWAFLRTQRAEHLNKLKKVSRNGQEPPSVTPLPTFEKFNPMNTPSGVHKQDMLATVYDAEKEFRAKAIDRDGFNDVRLYGNIQKTSNLRGEISKNCEKHHDSAECLSKIATMNKHGISLGLTVYEGTIDKELQLIEKISIVLPKQKVIWKLINEFFAKVYPFMPIIDETELKTEITRILGPEGYAEVPVELKVEKRLDFAYLGILLVMLRVTYLSLFSNRNGVNENNLHTTDPSKEAQELKYLLSNPINITLVDMAQECLEQFDFLRKTNFTVLQGAFLLRLYRMFAPEDGDGADVGDSQTYNAMLIQMAYSMGINREPTNNIINGLENVVDDLKTNNIQRKIWFFLVICDLIQGYKFGNPLSIDRKYYDTALPFYKPGNENIQDVELEKHVIGTFAYFERYYEKLLAILDTTLDISRDIKLSELTAQVTEFEVFLANNFGCLKDFLLPFDRKVYKYSFIKTMKCKNYINMRMFLNTVFYHLFLHYEKQQNTAFAYFYLKKVIVSNVGEFFPRVFHLISDNYVNFGEVADLILNPTIESMIHKVSQINFAILVRLNTSVYHMRHDPQHDEKIRTDFDYRKKFAKISQAALRMRKVSDFLLVAMSKLSQRYYYAWRVTKAHTFILKHLSDDAFYSSQTKPAMFPDLDDEQLMELTNIIGLSLNKNSKTKKSFGGDDTVVDEDKAAFTPAAAPPPSQPPLATTTTTSAAPLSAALNPEPTTSMAAIPPASKEPSEQVNPPSSEPVSVDAAFGDFDWEKELNIINNPDIDNLWLQMAQMKNDLSTHPIDAGNVNIGSAGSGLGGSASSGTTNGGSTGSGGFAGAGANPFTPASVMSYNSDGDQNKQDMSRVLSDFELFGTLPFERFFGDGGV